MPKLLASLALLLLLGAPLKADEARSVPSHGLQVHYRLTGQGEPLLVLGGGPGDRAERYTGLCELLAGHFRCILVEQRGTGRSKPATLDASTISVALTLDDLEAIRRQMGISRWAVLGFSYGGYLASLYAQRHPDRVSSLVLLGSLGLNWDALPHFQDNIASRLQEADRQLLEYWQAPARMEADPARAITETIRARMPGYFHDRTKALEVSQKLRPEDFDFPMAEWIHRDSQARGLDLATAPTAYTGPVLVLHGRQDPLGESVPLGLARHYPGSRLVIVERCGHYLWVEQPRQVLRAVLEFLAPRERRGASGVDMVLVPSGGFAMGSADGPPEERPVRRVRISRPFYLGRHPVTVGQFRRFVEETGYRSTAEQAGGARVWAGGMDWVQRPDASWRNPYFPQTDEHPVTCVSWHDAKAFCAWLTLKEGRTCRLPTEAEFEYALRAGTRTPWFFGSDPAASGDYGWLQALTDRGFPTHPVGRKRPNPWGLLDLVGNAWQWCEDWYDEKGYPSSAQEDPRGPVHGSSRVNRGGMGNEPDAWRSARRDALPPESNYSNQTFRIVMELMPERGGAR